MAASGEWTYPEYLIITEISIINPDICTDQKSKNVINHSNSVLFPRDKSQIVSYANNNGQVMKYQPP